MAKYAELDPEKDLTSLKDLPEGSDGDIIRFILSCRNEAKIAKWNRIQQTRENYDVFWGRHDFSHKQPGQSCETLAMQPMAVEQTAAFFQQALVDMGDEWWSAGAKNPSEASKLPIKPDTVQRITQLHLTKADILRHAGLGMKSGLLGGKIIAKIHGCWDSIPVYMAERGSKGKKPSLKKGTKKAWRLKLDVVSQFNYYPDPTGQGLYEIEDMYVDYHQMMAYAEGEDAIYDKSVCEQVTPHGDDNGEEKFDKLRRNNQNDASANFRGRVKLTEFWGTLLDTDGNILMENCVVTLANDTYLIRKPALNPNWHQESPFVTADLLDSPDAVWPKALADAGTQYNIAANELFNLMLDGAMRAVNGIGQIRPDWLNEPAQVENGIKPGTYLSVNGQCPPGAKVMEQLTSGDVPPDSVNLFSLLQQEFNRAMLTSDIRQGMTPRKDVSATQVVESNQTITSVFTGMSKQVEQRWIQKLLEKSWMTCCQFLKDMDEDELKSLIGKDDFDALSKMSAEEVFAATVGGVKFDVFGISLMLQKKQDFKNVMTLLQTIGGSEPLTEAFVKQYSFEETLNFAMKALGLPTRQLEIPHEEQEMMKAQAAQPPAPPGQPSGGSPSAPGAPQPPTPQGAGGPQMMSQVAAPQGPINPTTSQFAKGPQ